MIEDPPPPRGLRQRRLLWPALGFTLLMTVPVTVTLAVMLAAVAGRLILREVRHARARDAQTATRTAQDAGVRLGVDRAGKPVSVPEQALAAHGLILGATGAGKSTTLLTLLTDQVRRGRPVVAIDLKGSPGFAAELRGAALAAGREFELWTPDGGAHWNPLAAGNATELKDKLLGTERFTEPHYRRAAERYLQLAIQVARDGSPGRALTLARVVELMSPDRLAVAARGLPRERRDQLRDYLGSLTPDQHSAVRGLASRLAVLTESDTGPYLEPAPAGGHTLDLRPALDGGQVVVFSLNSSTYGGLAGMLGTLAVQDLVAAAGARLASAEQGGPAAIVGIDEFSALGQDNIVALMARGRASGIGVLLATQEFADLERAGRGLGDQIVGNTALKIAHRQEVPSSAETVAKLTGTVRVWERSHSRRSGTLSPQALSTSARLVERYAIEPEQVRTLRTGEAVVIVKTPRASAKLARISRRQPPDSGVAR